jgi:KipI family sensor histidine kinase inhibitor
MSRPPGAAAWVSDCSVRIAVPGASPAEIRHARRAAINAVNALAPVLLDVTAGYGTVLLTFDPLRIDPRAAEAALRRALAAEHATNEPAGPLRTLPVCYEGDCAPDLGELASLHGLTPADVVALHSGADYTVEFLGFSPGFPYLSGLPGRLATPRLGRPRPRVPAGSVGIGGSQTGVYPQPMPGGWRLIGRTPLRLFDATGRPPALLAPGDRVRFVPISHAEFDRLSAEPPGTPEPPPWREGVRVLVPGLASTVQDLGRPGHAAIGVSPSGAADEVSLRAGNRLVGNRDRAAAIEMTLTGYEAEFTRECRVALTGSPCDATIIGPRGQRALPHGAAHRVGAGERVRVGRIAGGARAYLCIDGGIATPPVLGGRATHVASGLGGLDGRALRAGDVLPLGEPGAPPPATTDAWRALSKGAISRRTLRMTRGPHADAFGPRALDTLAAHEFTVADQSDRTGIRLLGPAIAPPHGGRMLTEGMPPGAIQVTESGMPILLGADRPTTGGYPVIACVASVDLPALGQLPPRGRVRFEWIGPEDARRLYHAFRAALDRAIPPIDGPGAP